MDFESKRKALEELMETVLDEPNDLEKDDQNFSLFANAPSRQRLNGNTEKILRDERMLGPARYKPKFNTVMRKAP